MTYFPSSDFVVQQAIREIYSQYGVNVSVVSKQKSLLKFGRTANADADTKTTVATFPGSVINETFSTTNDIDGIVSSSASDTEVVTVEGHYFDGSNNLIFHTQDATLNGQTKVTLTQALCRCNRIFVKDQTFGSPASDLVGTIYVYVSSGVTLTAGVPQTDTAVKCMISAGKNQSEKCASSISSSDFYIITQVYGTCSRGNASTVNVDVDLEFRRLGGVWRPIGLEMSLRSGGQSADQIRLEPYKFAPNNSDIRLVATSNTDNTTVTGHVHGFLASVQS